VSFEELAYDKKSTEIVFVQDVEDETLTEEIIDLFDSISIEINRATLIITDQKEPNIVRMSARRDRVVFLHELVKEYLSDTEFLFGLEDDTIFPSYALKRLTHQLRLNGNAAYIEGVQCGRHNIKMIGAWRVDHLKEPDRVETIPMNFHPIVEAIDGGGYYCFATRTRLYKKVKKYWEHECFGPDMTYGLELRRMGYTCHVDFSVLCGHMTERGVLMPDRDVTTVTFKKRPDATWEMLPVTHKRNPWAKEPNTELLIF
jgi:hypothetical protein